MTSFSGIDFDTYEKSSCKFCKKKPLSHQEKEVDNCGHFFLHAVSQCHKKMLEVSKQFICELLLLTGQKRNSTQNRYFLGNFLKARHRKSIFSGQFAKVVDPVVSRRSRFVQIDRNRSEMLLLTQKVRLVQLNGKMYT